MEKVQSEKRKKNWKLANYFALGGIILGLLLIVILGVYQLVYNDKFNKEKEALNSFFGIPTPIPTISFSTDTPSDTPSESPSDSPTPQAQTLVNCNMTEYVPFRAMYVTTTPEKCAYAQQYAVNLWNSQHQQSRQIPPPPMPQYQAPQSVQYAEPNNQYAPIPQIDYSAPPAMGAPPAIQAPQVQQPAPLPNVPAPPKNCYSYSVGAGAVTVPCQ